MNVSLVMFKADGSRRDFAVTKPRIVVGRTNDCDLRIPLSSVSRQHCEFRLEGEQFKLQDLGSSNGTFRNNSRISQETLLDAGDEIVIGPVVFTVVIDGQPDTIDPVRTVLERNKQSSSESSSSASAVQPQRISFDTGVAMPSVEPELDSPTVDLDDPIAALEALAAGTNKPASNKPSTPPAAPAPSAADDDDDEELVALDPVEDDDDEPLVALEAVEDDDDDLDPLAALAQASGNDSPAPQAVDEDDVIIPLESDDDEDPIIPILDEDDDDIPLLADDDEDDKKNK